MTACWSSVRKHYQELLLKPLQSLAHFSHTSLQLLLFQQFQRQFKYTRGNKINPYNLEVNRQATNKKNVTLKMTIVILISQPPN